MKYKIGGEVKIGDKVKWLTTGSGCYNVRVGEIVALVYAGQDTDLEAPMWVKEAVMAGEMRKLSNNTLKKSNADRVLVVVSQKGDIVRTYKHEPILMAPRPGSLVPEKEWKPFLTMWKQGIV